jgi:hypothetical protein
MDGLRRRRCAGGPAVESGRIAHASRLVQCPGHLMGARRRRACPHRGLAARGRRARGGARRRRRGSTHDQPRAGQPSGCAGHADRRPGPGTALSGVPARPAARGPDRGRHARSGVRPVAGLRFIVVWDDGTLVDPQAPWDARQPHCARTPPGAISSWAQPRDRCTAVVGPGGRDPSAHPRDVAARAPLVRALQTDDAARDGASAVADPTPGIESPRRCHEDQYGV